MRLLATFICTLCLIPYSFAMAQEEPSEKEPLVEDLVNRALEKGDMDGGPLQVTIDAAVSLNYVFADSPDSFVVTYKLKIDEAVANKIDVRKGRLIPTTDIKGFLAKWPMGECSLKISIPSVPYEIIANRTKESELRIDLKINDTLLETWESNCTFKDAPGAKFNTRGSPERWLDNALKKTTPSLRQLIVTLNPGETTAASFKIERHDLPDPPIGSVEIEGRGTVNVQRK
jgi:hypothetical protein